MTSGADIAFASAEGLAEVYRKKALSPVEAAEMLFGRIDALQPELNAFVFVDRDGAKAHRSARSTACRSRSRTSC
jgi:Asp-tRNA(Asn)/Glu-tRNA(Gln) amidotransferase A subunit family amidase